MRKPDTLVADIGGTNARFALVRGSHPTTLECTETLPTSGYPTLLDALQHYLNKHQIKDLAAMTLAVAAPIVDGKAKFTNASWIVNRKELAAHFCSGRVKLMNDFEAIALALPELKPNDLHHLGKGRPTSMPSPHFGVLGAGTGLGAATLLVRDNKHIPLGCEAGHTTFAPENIQQQKILEYLLKFHKRVSYERVVSGMGIENIYAALSPTYQKLKAKDIFNSHLNQSDTIASEAVAEFTRILGQFAGNFALTTGCYDGIFLAGGVIAKQLAAIDAFTFRESFENKWRHRALMHSIPTSVVTHEQQGLLGAAIAKRSTLTQD